MKKCEEFKKSNWGGRRSGAGRKPKTELESRQIFKMAFDKVVNADDWSNIIKEAWDSKNWNMIKFLIEQRIGKSFDLSEAEQSEPITGIKITIAGQEYKQLGVNNPNIKKDGF